MRREAVRCDSWSRFSRPRLGFEKWFDDRVGGNGLTVVVADRAQAIDELRRQRETDEVEHLAVAILLDHVHALVARNECNDLSRKRKRANAQVVDRPLSGLQGLARLDHRSMRRPEGDQTDS